MPDVRVERSTRSSWSLCHASRLPGRTDQRRVYHSLATEPHAGRQTPTGRGHRAPVANLQPRQPPSQPCFSADGLQGFGEVMARPVLVPVCGTPHAPQGTVGPHSPRGHVRLRLDVRVGPPDAASTLAAFPRSAVLRSSVGSRCPGLRCAGRSRDGPRGVLRRCAAFCGVRRRRGQPGQSRRHQWSPRPAGRGAGSRGRRHAPSLLGRSASRSPSRWGAFSSLLLRSCVR